MVLKSSGGAERNPHNIQRSRSGLDSIGAAVHLPCRTAWAISSHHHQGAHQRLGETVVAQASTSGRNDRLGWHPGPPSRSANVPHSPAPQGAPDIDRLMSQIHKLITLDDAHDLFKKLSGHLTPFSLASICGRLAVIHRISPGEHNRVRLLAMDIVKEFAGKVMQSTDKDIAFLFTQLVKLNLPTIRNSIPVIVDHYLYVMLAEPRGTTAKSFAAVCWSLAHWQYGDERAWMVLLDASHRISPKLEPHELVNTTWAFAKMGKYRSVNFNRLCAYGTRCVPRLSARAVAIMTWSFANVQHYNLSFLEAAGTRLLQSFHQLDMQSVSMIIGAFAKLGHRRVEVLDLLCDRIRQMEGSLGAQAVSQIWWGLACLDYLPGDLQQCLAVAAQRESSSLTSQGVANITSAYAKMGVKNLLLEETLVQGALDVMHRFKGQELANLAWGLTMMDFGTADLFQAIAQHAIKIADELNAADLSTLVWAFASCGYSHPPMTQKLAVFAVNRLTMFAPLELCNLVWGLAILGLQNKIFYRAAAEQVQRLPSTVDSHIVTQLLYGFARAKYPAHDAVEWLAQRLVKGVKSYKPHEVSRAVWSLSRLQYYNSQSFMAVEAAVMAQLASYSPVDLMNIMHAMSKARYYSHKLFCSAAQQLSPEVSSLSGEGLSFLVKAYAMVGHRDLALMKAVVSAVSLQMSDISVYHMVQIIWSLALLQYPDIGFFTVALQCITASGVDLLERYEEAMAQLFQADVLLADLARRGTGYNWPHGPPVWPEAPSGTTMDQSSSQKVVAQPRAIVGTKEAVFHHPFLLPPEVYEAGINAWLRRTEAAELSEDQRDICEFLRDLGCNVLVQCSPPGSLLTIDLALEVDGQMIACEYEGPRRYTRSCPHHLLAGAQVRRVMLANLGWKVVFIPYYEWQQQTADVSRRRYLADVLAGLGIESLGSREVSLGDSGGAEGSTGPTGSEALVAQQGVRAEYGFVWNKSRSGSNRRQQRM